MDNEISRYDLTSADTKIIGFDFQYFYFINELLKLQIGQTIGYEAKDDVHIEIYSNSRIITKLIQLKHTVHKNADGSPGNLTDRDDDLWKTLSNWCKVICDNNRKKIVEQLNFLKETKFIFATNKKIDKNTFISNINKLQVNKMKFTELYKYLSKLENSTKDANVKKHIHDVITLNNKVLKLFFENLNFVDTGDEIIESIKSSIQGKMIAKNRVNDVFNALFSELKQDFLKMLKQVIIK